MKMPVPLGGNGRLCIVPLSQHYSFGLARRIAVEESHENAT